MSMRSWLTCLFFCLMTLWVQQGASRSVDAQPNICRQPPPYSSGLCTIEIEGYYFDGTTQDCEIYSIGACRLIPGQSFGSRDDCVATCVRGTRRIQDLYLNE